MAAWPAQFGVARTGTLHHLLLRDQFREKVHVFGAGRQEKSIYIGTSEITGIDSNLFEEPRGRFSILHPSMSPHGSLFDNFDDGPKIGATISIRYILEQPRTGDKITIPVKL
jgi:hypothetical protein